MVNNLKDFNKEYFLNYYFSHRENINEKRKRSREERKKQNFINDSNDYLNKLNNQEMRPYKAKMTYYKIYFDEKLNKFVIDEDYKNQFMNSCPSNEIKTEETLNNNEHEIIIKSKKKKFDRWTDEQYLIAINNEWCKPMKKQLKKFNIEYDDTINQFKIINNQMVV